MMSAVVEYVSSYTGTSQESEDSRVLREHSVSDLITLLPQLARNVSMNVRFHNPTAFEFTKEVSALEAVPRLRLVHGWLVDPADKELSSILQGLSYNQLLEKLSTRPVGAQPATSAEYEPSAPLMWDELTTSALSSAPQAPQLYPIPTEGFLPQAELNHMHFSFPPALRASPSLGTSDTMSGMSEATDAPLQADDELPPHALNGVHEFLETYSGMLTYHGLAELHAMLNEEEMALLFRSAGFFVLRKKAGYLYCLVTDTGYAEFPAIVWQRLSDIDGNTDFFDAAFNPSAMSNDHQQQNNRKEAARPPESPVTVTTDWEGFRADPLPSFLRDRAHTTPASSSAHALQGRRRCNRASHCSTKQTRGNDGTCAIQ